MSNFYVKLEGTACIGHDGLSYSNMDAFLCYNPDKNKHYCAMGSINIKLFETKDEARQAALTFRKSAYCYRNASFEIESVKS
jgi:hypothetical protein